MKYDIDKPPVVYNLRLSAKEVVKAIRNYADDYSLVDVPEDAAIYISHSHEHNMTTARIRWEDEN